MLPQDKAAEAIEGLGSEKRASAVEFVSELQDTQEPDSNSQKSDSFEKTLSSTEISVNEPLTREADVIFSEN